jgi:hypothetical protein
MAAFRERLDDTSMGKLTISGGEAFTDLVVALAETADIERLDVMTDEDTITALRHQFLTGAHLEEYIQGDVVNLRSQRSPLPTLLCTESNVTAIAGLPDGPQWAFETSDEEYVTATQQRFADEFQAASTPRLRHPNWSAMCAAFEETFNVDVFADFKSGIQAALADDGRTLAIDSVHLSLLLGGFHELSFYELARMAEDIQLGSPATYSRKKQELEDAGLIDVEPMETDVGRPRQRLLLGPELSGSQDIVDVITTAIET